MRTIAYIPARCGSRGIPDKNIRELNGRPLLLWAVDTAVECNIPAYVSSDSEKYLDLVRLHTNATPLLRNEKYARDTTTMWETVYNDMQRLNLEPDDVVVLLQPTSPFRKAADILRAIEMLKYDQELNSVVSVSKVPDEYHPDEVFVRKAHGFTMASGLPIGERKTRRQDYAEACHPNGQFYVFRWGHVKGGTLYGNKTEVLYIENAPNINSEDDWKKAEEYLKNRE